jgi:hypothetical protein
MWMENVALETVFIVSNGWLDSSLKVTWGESRAQHFSPTLAVSSLAAFRSERCPIGLDCFWAKRWADDIARAS